MFAFSFAFTQSEWTFKISRDTLKDHSLNFRFTLQYLGIDFKTTYINFTGLLSSLECPQTKVSSASIFTARIRSMTGR